MSLQVLIAALIGLPPAIWLAGLLRWRRAANRPRSQTAPRGVSVLVAARNEEQNIGRMLTSVLGGVAEEPTPIIVVDDHSTDRTYRIAESFGVAYPSLQVVAAESDLKCLSPKKNALRRGLSQVSTQFVALSDADCRVKPDWLKAMTDETDERTGVVLGASFPPRGTTPSEFMYRAERLIANCVMASSCGWGHPSSACGHNLVYRTVALREIGGFAQPEIPSGDDDLTVQAIARRGWKAEFASSPSSVVLDCGGSGRTSRWQSASRHQSVLKYYPFGWRALFAWSVVAHIAALFTIIALSLGARSNGALIGAASLIVFDVSSGVLFARKLRLDVTVFEILAGAILLPFWTIWRAASALFGNSYSWRGRSFHSEEVKEAGA